MNATITVMKCCPICMKFASLEVSEEKFRQWKNGTKIQEAFNDLSPDQREVLLTGIHPECWDVMFPLEARSV